jgi:hypothetical protein
MVVMAAHSMTCCRTRSRLTLPDDDGVVFPHYHGVCKCVHCESTFVHSNRSEDCFLTATARRRGRANVTDKMMNCSKTSGREGSGRGRQSRQRPTTVSSRARRQCIKEIGNVRMSRPTRSLQIAVKASDELRRQRRKRPQTVSGTQKEI